MPPSKRLVLAACFVPLFTAWLSATAAAVRHTTTRTTGRSTSDHAGGTKNAVLTEQKISASSKAALVLLNDPATKRGNRLKSLSSLRTKIVKMLNDSLLADEKPHLQKVLGKIDAILALDRKCVCKLIVALKERPSSSRGRKPFR